MSVAPAPAAGGNDALLAELRALRKLIAAMPLVRLDSGRQASLLARGVG
jgi:hypothetical protein